MPTITNPGSFTNPITPVRSACQVKRQWSDPWQFLPYLRCTTCSTGAAPEMPTADLIYRFGTIRRSDADSMSLWTPLDLVGAYVRVLALGPYGTGAAPVWTGTIAEQQTSLVSANPEGVQAFKAYGLAHILDRIQCNFGIAWERDAPQKLEWLPTFNQRHRRGRSLLGNRTAEPPTDTLPESEAAKVPLHLFSRDGELWTNLQIADLVLAMFEPAAFSLTVTGQIEILDEIVEVHRLEGLSVWQALNRLIDRRRGAGFVIEDDEAGNVWVRVFSVADVEVAIGGRSLPANPQRLTFRVPSQFPGSHLLADIQLRRTDANRVNQIIVQGERMRVCGTFAFRDKTLSRAWSGDLADDYIVAEGAEGDEAATNDAIRSGDRFEGVFSRFIVPADWDGLVGDGEGGEKKNLWLVMGEDGLIDTTAAGPFWRFGKTFERDLPFAVGKAYDEPPPAEGEEDESDENPEDSEPEFRPLAVWVVDRSDGPQHEKSDLWLWLDRLSEYDPKFPNVTIRPLDKDLGFVLQVSPRHYFARGHFEDATLTRVEPEFNYEDLVVTASLVLDTRVRITLTRETELTSDAATTVVITVDGAEFWYAPTGTVYDLDDEGQPKRVHSERRILRTDGDKLELAAAQAAAWYGRARQAVQIPIKRVGLFAPIGAMLVAIESVYAVEPIAAPITGRHIDFTTGSTTLDTSFAALDFSDLAAKGKR